VRLSRFGPLVLAVASIVAAAPGAQARYVGNLNVFVGYDWLNQGEWSPVDQQKEWGLMLGFAEERAPIHFVVDVFASKDNLDDANPAPGTRVRSSSTQLAIGVRKVWDRTVTRPHLGAGADILEVKEEIAYPYGPVNNEDRAYGAWVDFGVTWRLAGHLNLGLESRYTYATANLGQGSLSRDVAAGGFHLGVLIGYGW
jgi:hypothetical protein